MIAYVLMFVLCFISACGSPQYSDFFPYHNDGTPKPSVALLPVFDKTKTVAMNNVSQDLSQKIRLELMHHSKLYIPTAAQLKQQQLSCSQDDLLNSKDLMPFLHFQPEHFVVVLELVEFEQKPYKKNAVNLIYPPHVRRDEASMLSMKMRLKIVDIRGQEPKLIRQEIIPTNYVLATGEFEDSLEKEGTDAFQITPVGKGIQRFVQNVVEKIEKNSCF